ncbi:MAG: beta-propeller fold lactonase family protein [Solirubrobacterales bacterium]|nr:beta-propeller fold lactonase family protein [Solirubrobacterales bacterium]
MGLLLVAVALLAPWAADAAKQGAGKKSGVPHRFYTQTNNPAGNTVLVYNRAANGTISLLGNVATGGKGQPTPPGTPTFGLPVVDSQGSVDLTPDGKLLFVVNAGDNTVTSFEATASGLKKVDRVSTHGKLPVSLATSGHLLYVLNGLSYSIYGWHFSSTGKLTPIAGSDRKLKAVTPKGKKDKNGAPAGIGFSANGDVLAVTQRALPRKYGEIDTFVIARDGSAGPARATATPGIDNPFGFSAVGRYFLISNAGQVNTANGAMPQVGDFTQFTGTAATYKVSNTGKLTLVSNVKTGGRAACWLIVTKNGRRAFVTNTLGSTAPTGGVGAVSSLSVAGNGKMTLSHQASTAPGFPADMALSNDDKYLYVIDPSSALSAPPPAGLGIDSQIDVYRVGSGGSLTEIQATPATLPPGISGAGAF